MLKKLFSIISVLLIVSMVTPFMSSAVLAISLDESIKSVAYIDGVEFEIISTYDETIIRVNDPNNKGEAHFALDGEAYLETYNDKGEKVRTDLVINDLNDEKIDIDYTDENGNLAKITKVDVDEYEGQTSIVLGYGGWTILKWIVGLILAYLVAKTVVYIAKEAYIALDYALKEKRISKTKYYCAEIVSGSVYISSKSITKSAAAARIKARKNTYTFYGSDARSVVVSTGLGVVGPEIDKKTTTSGKIKRGVYYYHYHTRNRNGAHSFYGSAYIY